jgi:hypothetical protein
MAFDLSSHRLSFFSCGQSCKKQAMAVGGGIYHYRIFDNYNRDSMGYYKIYFSKTTGR